MPEFKLTLSDGSQYKVEADNIEQATKDLAAHRQAEVSTQTNKEFADAPMWAKPFRAADDLVRGTADVFSFGQADKYLGGDTGIPGIPNLEQMKTEAAKQRSGWAGTAADTLAVAGSLPTAVPRVVARMGGGPAARTIVGAGTAAGEGAAYGAGQAIGHDRPAGPESTIGVISGVLGNVAGNLTNRAAKWWKGIDDTPHAYTPRVLKENPTPQDRVNFAKAEAERTTEKGTGTLQKNYRNEFTDVKTETPRRDFSKAEWETLNRIIKGDPATVASGAVGNTLSNKWVAGPAALTTGASASPILGLLQLATTMGGGAALKKISEGGTKEAVQDLRRLMQGKKDKYRGPVSEEAKARLGMLARQPWMESLED